MEKCLNHARVYPCQQCDPWSILFISVVFLIRFWVAPPLPPTKSSARRTAANQSTIMSIAPQHPDIFRPESGALAPNPWAHAVHRPVFLSFLAALAFAIVRLMLGFAEGWAATQALLWLAAATTAVVGLSRRLPGQNVSTAILLITGMAVTIGYVGDRTGIPFGPRLFTDRLGVRVAGLPWTWPLVWLVAVLSARGVARLIMRPWRKTTYYGFWVIGVACALVVAFGLALEPFAVRIGRFWIWRIEPTVWSWYGAPWVNFFGWLATSLGILGFTTPWLINKQPVKQPTDYHPLVIWSLLICYFSAGAIREGLWSAVVVNVLGLCLAAGLAIRGARW